MNNLKLTEQQRDTLLYWTGRAVLMGLTLAATPELLSPVRTPALRRLTDCLSDVEKSNPEAFK